MTHPRRGNLSGAGKRFAVVAIAKRFHVARGPERFPRRWGWDLGVRRVRRGNVSCVARDGETFPTRGKVSTLAGAQEEEEKQPPGLALNLYLAGFP